VKGCTELGVMYCEGKAVKKDVQRAIDLFEIACKGGSEAACKNHELLTKKSGDK
jgi:TPR repeat protein